jgi:hypothetical protein
MSFKLNIGGKMTGNGTTGFGQKASAVIEKCKSMANYMGTLETNVTEAPMNFNAGLRKASADGKLNDSPKFKSAVDASGMNMNDSGMYQRGGKDEFGTTIPDMSAGGDNEVTGTLNRKDMKMTRNNTVKGKKVGDDYTSGEDIRDGSGNKISQKVTNVKKIAKKSQTQTKEEKPKEVEITRKAGSVKFT